MSILCCTNRSGSPYYDDYYSRETCVRGGDRGIDIDDLPDATITNIHNYKLSGSCGHHNTEVRVFVERRTLDDRVICNRGKWEVYVDLTGDVSQKERFQVAASQGGSGGRVCREVQNLFYCGDGYIGISNVSGKSSDNFCVMQYEARFEPGEEETNYYNRGNYIEAKSIPNGSIITNVSITDAIQYCRNNARSGGVGYNLMTNEEWQIIARSIELEDSNWNLGESVVAGDNYLNLGNIRGRIEDRVDISDERSERWNLNTRFHRLLNGAYIWDFSGNVWEIVSHNLDDLPDDYRGFIYKVSREPELKNLIGPRKNYTSLDTTTERYSYASGLGYAELSGGGVLLRGGSVNSFDRGGGIFSARSVRSSLERTNDVGFRCTFRP